MRTVALLLAVMVPSASSAHGLGPDEDAPVLRQPLSARLLSQEQTPQEQTATPRADVDLSPSPAYKSVGLWIGLSLLTAMLVGAGVLVGFIFFLPKRHPTPCTGCMTGTPGGTGL
jgi:hypothetical protein